MYFCEVIYFLWTFAHRLKFNQVAGGEKHGQWQQRNFSKKVAHLLCSTSKSK